ncbi:IS110 family transposase [Mycobacterium timonense]|uniref:IS110 family transposase n=1 Tax=Mycobacterium timonense TaxID=701043 RepID=UPI0023EA616D|nr:transposase [Mycobacterium timonense]
MLRIWAGIDTGKRSHHCVVLDEHGDVLLSKKVDNDETALLELIGAVAGIAAGGQTLWATDLNAGGAAMLIGLVKITV